jgi:hypothetical protein
MNEPTLKLPGAADQLLQSFPANEPDFEAQAKAIEARIAAGSAKQGVAVGDLLKAPELSAEAGEPGAPSQVRAVVAPKTNFAEMARKSLQKKDDSAELTKELLAATAQSRRPDAQMVERVRAAGRASATVTPLPSTSSSTQQTQTEASTEEAARPSGVVARPLPAAPAAPAATANQRGTIIGIAGVAVGIAACVALFLKSGESQNPTSAALAAEQAAQQRAAAPKAVPGAAAPAAKTEEGVMSPEALAAAPQALGAHDVAKSAVRGTPAAGPALAPSKAGAAPSAVAQQNVVLDDDPAPAPVAAAEPKVAAAPPEPPLKPAQGSSGDVPLTPSAGAVSTALSSVRGGAQACLAGQTESVTAVVTFAADGHVLRVSAAGPSGACIQAALAKAHIAPFARESFSATTTIRPP